MTIAVMYNIIIGSAIAGLICYRTLALPNMKPLTKEEIELCRGIVEKGKGYPRMHGRAAIRPQNL
ncbi:MAG: hypothetical protein KAU17_14480 [Spirochaetales bacterium]|nr:hypothetical protein [Spirochaetales bacterium]